MAGDMLPLGNGHSPIKPRLKVVGIGGAGCNAVSGSGFESIGLYNHRDDVRALSTHRMLKLTDDHIQFVRSTSPRLMAAIDHEVPKQIKRTIGEADIIFVFAGLGGETGSYVAPAVIQLCRKLCDLVMVSTVLPFSMEGIGRKEAASRSLSEVIEASHTTITYRNDGLLDVAPNLPLRRALKVMDGIMMIPPVELSQVLTIEDLASLRSDLAGAKHLRFGMGIGVGLDKDFRAVEEAFTSPWFDFDHDDAKLAIAILSSGQEDDPAFKDTLRDISNRIPNAKIRFARRTDPSLGDRSRLMLLLAANGH